MLGLVGEARDRASALIEVENAAHRAGVSNVDQVVAAYAKEYDALQRLKDSRQTMGDGFNNAVTQWLEGVRKIGDESQKLFTSVFDRLGDGFADTIRNGRDGFKSMIDGLASDILRFASRQLFRTLLSSIFGDGQGGTGSNTGTLGGLGSSLLSALGVGAARTQAASAASVASSAGGSVGGASILSSGAAQAIGSATQQAATQVTALSTAATSATSSFGSIPGQIASMLQGIGASPSGVAGMLGNVQRESRFAPDAVNPSSGAYGLFQYLGSRRTALFNQYGTNPTAEQQIEFARNELLNNRGDSGNALSYLRSAGTLEQGVAAGVRFERPEGYASALRAGDLTQVPDFNTRLRFGQGFVGGTSTSGGLSLDGATLSDDTVNNLNRQFDNVANATEGLETSFSQTGNALAQSVPQLQSGVDGVVGTLRDGGPSIGQSFQTLNANIGEAGNGLSNALTSLASRLASAGGSFSNLFGVGSITDVGQGWAGDGLSLAGSANWFHAGGIVGQDGRRSGTMDTSLWDNAPRFHSGGIVGPASALKSRERAIVAMDDEAVFPTVRMPDGSFGIRATGFNGGGGGGATSFTMGDINITTQGSSGDSKMDQDNAKMIGREVDAVIEAKFNELFQRQMRSGGAFRRGLTS